MCERQCDETVHRKNIKIGPKSSREFYDHARKRRTIYTQKIKKRQKTSSSFVAATTTITTNKKSSSIKSDNNKKNNSMNRTANITIVRK